MATKIKIFDPTRLRQEEARTFHEMMTGLTAMCTHELVTAVQALYVTAYNAFKAALKPDAKSQVTAEMTELDNQRDQLFVAFRSLIRALTAHFDKQKAATAQAVYDIIRKYGEVMLQPYFEESGSLDDLVEDLNRYDNPTPSEPEEDEPVVQSVAEDDEHNRLSLIDAKIWVDEIKRVNDLFKSAFMKRLQEQSGNTTGLTASTRRETDTAYTEVIRKINAVIELYGDEGLTDMVAQMNELIDYQATVIKARETKNAKKKEETNNPTDETTPPADDQVTPSPTEPSEDEPVVQ